MRIYISYSQGAPIAYCFWKCFFRSCGVWVTSEKIEEGWSVDKTKKPQLIIFDEKTQKKYEDPSPNIVYCIKEFDEANKKRRDMLKISQWRDMHHSVIQQLLAGDEMLYTFIELVDIFGGTYTSFGKMIDEGLWSAVWLFHEIAQQAGNADWDREIYGKADKAIGELQRSKNISWYHEYMMLYCRYLQCGVNRSSIYRMTQCKKLLEQCGELSKGERIPTLAFLAGKISLLTSTENKYAVFYFKEVSDYEPHSDIFYEIGHIYELAYGDYSLALKYYQKAYQRDPDYYRALYKLAVKLERSEDWQGAVSVYNKIWQIICKVKLKNDIGVRDLEYEYKSCRRMLWLFKKYSNDCEMEESFQKHIEDMNQNLADYINFHKLFQKMFLTQNQSKKELEIQEELHRKLGMECCK